MEWKVAAASLVPLEPTDIQCDGLTLVPAERRKFGQSYPLGRAPIDIAWSVHQSSTGMFKRSTESDSWVTIGLEFFFRTSAEHEDDKGRELKIKLWHASGQVRSTSESTCAATALKVTISAWRPDPDAPAGITAIHLEPLSKEPVVVQAGRVADDTGRKYTLVGHSGSLDLTASATPSATLKGTVDAKQVVQEAAKAGDAIPVVKLEHTMNHFHALNTTTSCTIVLTQNVWNSLLCGKQNCSLDLGYLGGSLTAAGAPFDFETSGVQFNGFTATTADVPVFVRVSAQLDYIKIKQLKKEETVIGKYLIDQMAAKKKVGLQGVAKIKLMQQRFFF